MKPVKVKILSIFQIILRLQLITGVIEDHQLYPRYIIPTDDLPMNFAVPLTSECIRSFRYAKDETKTYIGVNVNNDKFVYSEVNQNFSSDDKCIFHDPSIYDSLNIFYTNDDNLMLLMRGCYFINSTTSVNSTFVLMTENWTEEFLKEGLIHFHISPNYDEGNIFEILYNDMMPCIYGNCSIYQDGYADCVDILSEVVVLSNYQNEFFFFYMMLSIFFVVVIAFGFWYQCD